MFDKKIDNAGINVHGNYNQITQYNDQSTNTYLGSIPQKSDNSNDNTEGILVGGAFALVLLSLFFFKTLYPLLIHMRDSGYWWVLPLVSLLLAFPTMSILWTKRNELLQHSKAQVILETVASILPIPLIAITQTYNIPEKIWSQIPGLNFQNIGDFLRQPHGVGLLPLLHVGVLAIILLFAALNAFTLWRACMKKENRRVSQAVLGIVLMLVPTIAFWVFALVGGSI